MATANYMLGRKKYSRPQAILFSENSGTLVAAPTIANPDYKVYLPNGYEVNADTGSETNQNNFNQFLILSDDNRAAIDVNTTRIEKRERMINGRMRSYHIADKLNISTSWNNLPSRSHYFNPEFGSDGKPKESISTVTTPAQQSMQYTTDGGAGGVELLDWYEKHTGSFWVYLAYDKYSNFGKDDNAYAHLPQYNQVLEMFISDFKYSIIKRGSSNYDFWNVNITLEEA
jgi:hypothetical protein